MYIKGFTLIEMLLVLMMMSIFILLSPLLSYSHGTLSYEIYRIADIINSARNSALMEKRIVTVKVENTYMEVGNKHFDFAQGIVCTPLTFHFNQKGNINMANTINCSNTNNQKEIVLHLGSGHLDVR